MEFTKIFELPQWQDASFLHQKYVVEGFSSAQIADEIGCSKTSVKKGLRIFKIRKNGHGVHAANLALGQKIVKGKVVEHKGESQLLTAIMKMHQQQRLSTTAIAKILNDMKVPTKKQGKAWDHSTVRRILLRSGVCENNGRGS